MGSAHAILGTATAFAAFALLVVSASGTPTETKLAPSDAAANAQFGHAVALDAGTAVVAANKGGSGNDSGSVYVFARSGAAWSQQAKLLPGSATANNEFGEAVAVHGDTVVVGAPYDDVPGTNTGSVFVFVRSGVVWTEEQKLIAADANQSENEFGFSVAVDGDTVVVGVPGGRTPSTRTGSAYVFIRAGTVWTQQQKLVAPDATFNDEFGHSVAVRGDTVLVGTSDDGDAGFHSGSVYVFVRSGTAWSLQQKIVAADGAADDRFGWSVGLSGETAVIGAPYLGIPSATKHGAAYVFVRGGTTWTQEGKLTASDAPVVAVPGQFGLSVSVSGDTVVAGAALDDATAIDSGAAYVFARTGTTWTQVRKLKASDGVTLDYFGQSVAVSGDTALAGAFGRDDAGSVSGSAYAFEGLAADPGPGGRSVSIDSFLLPTKVVVKTNAKSPAKSKVTISGVFDEGSVQPCFTEPATLEFGNAAPFAIPGMVAKGSSFEHSEPGLLFRVTPGKTGSSRGAFLLVRTGDPAAEVNRDGDLRLRFAGTGIDAAGVVTLAGGKYTLGKVRGRLIEPCWFPQSVALTVKAAGQDKLALVMGFDTAGYDVTLDPCWTIAIGGAFTAEIPRGSFTVKGQTLVFKGNVNGITDVRIDLANELITVKGKAMTLTGLVPASGPVKITVTLDTVALGIDERSVNVQLSASGPTLKY